MSIKRNDNRYNAADNRYDTIDNTVGKPAALNPADKSCGYRKFPSIGRASVKETYFTNKSSGKLLLVEDDVRLMELMESICRTRGYDVTPAYDGRRALDVYREHRETLRGIITDCDMPHMDGIELMRNILQSGNGVPVVLATGRHFEEDEWKREGFRAYLQKPFTFSDFTNCLDTHFSE